MHFDIDKQTVFLTVTGSHAYGMSRETSDVDIRGAAATPRRVRDSFYRRFKQFESTSQVGPWGATSQKALDRLEEHRTAGPCWKRNPELDVTIYSLTKLVGLAAENNPNVLELLFVEDSDLLYANPVWERIAENRDLFLSKMCRVKYNGYAMSQLKRIKRHREWLLNPPTSAPMRGDYDLPEESVLPADVRNQIDEVVKKIMQRWQFTDGFEDHLKGAALDTLVMRLREFHVTYLRCEEELLDEKVYELAGASLGLTKDVLNTLKQERRYRSALKNWKQYMTWKKERNEGRAALEAAHGYDTKHASHLVRLLRTGKEILSGEGLKVRRPDADELKAVRDGALSYDELMEQATALQGELQEAAASSTLPKTPDHSKIDDLLFEALELADRTM